MNPDTIAIIVLGMIVFNLFWSAALTGLYLGLKDKMNRHEYHKFGSRGLDDYRDATLMALQKENTCLCGKRWNHTGRCNPHPK